MNTEDLLKKIRRIEIKTKGLTKHVFSGEYHSHFKGRGMAFSEVRDYQFGDEVRTIDWNVTARFNTPFVKVFEEERELTVMLMIDVSESTMFGTNQKLKKELMLELCAVLAFSAESNNDKVGAILFSDKVEKYIEPAKGKKHMLYLLRELIEFQATSKQTDINEGLRFFRQIMKKRSIAFVLSDFKTETPFMDSFNLIRRKHDVIALKVVDEAELNLPNVGVVKLFNAESKQTTWVDTALPSVQQQFKEEMEEAEQTLQTAFKKNGIDYALFNTSADYIPQLIKLLSKRK
jgi:uncharacterized protein (DUF58 family)